MRRPGWVTPTRAASMLGVHVNTVYAWCKRSVQGEPSKLSNVERHPVTGYYWIALKEVEILRSGPKFDSE